MIVSGLSRKNTERRLTGGGSRKKFRDQRQEKKKQAEHRTATTAYPCYLPILGEFSRSWSCRPAGGKDTTGIELFVQRGKIIR
jgi:hypothetical protein